HVVEDRINRRLLQRLDLVVLKEGPVGQPNSIEAPGPLRRQVEASARFDGAAKVPKAGRRRAVDEKLILVELVASGAANRKLAVFETLAPLAAKQRALGGGEPRRNSGVVVGSKCEIIGCFDGKPVPRTRRYDRHQEAGLAFDGRIG